jgi:hypothetical protein
MNTKEFAEAHTAEAKRTTDSWHRHAAVPTFEAQARARATEAQAKSDALRRSAEYHRNLPLNG